MVSDSLSSTMNDCKWLMSFDHHGGPFSPTTETTTVTASAAVIDSINVFHGLPLMLDFQIPGAIGSGNSKDSYNINNTVIPQSSYSCINMLHRNSNSVSSFSSSSSSSTMPDISTNITFPNDTFYLQKDIALSLPLNPDIITTTTLNGKGKTNYHQQQPIIPLSSCSGTPSSSSNLNFHLNNNINNNNKKSLNQYKNRKQIRAAPYSPSSSSSSSSFLTLPKRNPRADKQRSTTSTKRQQRTVKGCYTTTKRTYERSDPCHECGRTFSRPKDLKRHETTVHAPQTIHQCHKCGHHFRRKDSLLRHERTKTDCCRRHRRRHR